MRTTYLFILLISLSVFSGCALTKPQRRANRATKQLNKEMERHGRKMDRLKAKWADVIEINESTVQVDTTLPEVQIKYLTVRDTVVEDSIVREYIRDTTVIREFVDRFYKATADTAVIDTAGVTATVTGSNLNVNITRAEQTITQNADCPDEVVTKEYTVVRRRFYQDWVFWVLAVVLGVVWYFRDIVQAWIRGINTRL